MSQRTQQKKTCMKGHVFHKSGDCPTCPVCEKEKTQKGIFSDMSAPARRALDSAGIKTLKQLSERTEREILDLHGMGPGSIPTLRKALKKKGFTFKV